LQGRLKANCPKYDVELARAWERQHLTSKIAELTKDDDRVEQRHTERRDRAQAAMDKASGELAVIQPARIANSDSKALTRYLDALGLEVGPDRLNDLLVLLSVLMIEAGGGLSLAIGMALSGASGPAVTEMDGEVTDAPRTTATGASEPAAARPAVPDTYPVVPAGTRTPAGQVGPDCPTGVVGTLRTVRPTVVAAVRALESDVLARLAASGGVVEGVRRLAEALGRPRSTVSDECRRLAATGHLTMTRGRRGTVLALAAGRVN
jgi:hypothetical protein